MKRRKSRGQGLTEFALVAPVLFLLLFVTIEAARFVFYYHTLNNAVREGARYAIVHGSNALDGCPSGPPHPQSTVCDPTAENVRKEVVNAAFGIVELSALRFPAIDGCPSAATTPNPCYERNTNYRGNSVTLYVEYTYAPIVPVVPEIVINAESTLVINN